MTDIPRQEPSTDDADVGDSSTGMTGWLVHKQPPAQPLDHIVITDARGRTLANRAMTYSGRGLHSWDVILAQLGFRRAGDWDPTPGGYVCPVITR